MIKSTNILMVLFSINFVCCSTESVNESREIKQKLQGEWSGVFNEKDTVVLSFEENNVSVYYSNTNNEFDYTYEVSDEGIITFSGSIEPCTIEIDGNTLRLPPNNQKLREHILLVHIIDFKRVSPTR